MAGSNHGQFDVGRLLFIPYPKHAESQKESHGFISAIYLDHANQLWLGTEQGLDRYDREQDVFITYHHDPADPQSLSHDWVSSIVEDQSVTLWIGGRRGLNCLDRKSNTFQHYQHDPNDPKSLGGNLVMEIFEDRSGVLWVGTNDGGVSYTARKKPASAKLAQCQSQHTPARWLQPRAAFSCRLCRQSQGGCFSPMK